MSMTMSTIYKLANVHALQGSFHDGLAAKIHFSNKFDWSSESTVSFLIKNLARGRPWPVPVDADADLQILLNSSPVGVAADTSSYNACLCHPSGGLWTFDKRSRTHDLRIKHVWSGHVVSRYPGA